MISPDAIRVPLNTWPEKSSNVPSLLKCSCHQSLSGVVAIDRVVPTASTVITSAARRREQNHAVRTFTGVRRIAAGRIGVREGESADTRIVMCHTGRVEALSDADSPSPTTASPYAGWHEYGPSRLDVPSETYDTCILP